MGRNGRHQHPVGGREFGVGRGKSNGEPTHRKQISITSNLENRGAEFLEFV